MNRALPFIALFAGLVMVVSGLADPLVLPVLAGLTVGVAARGGDRFDAWALFAAGGALLVPDPRIAAAAWAAVLLPVVRDPRRIVPVLVGVGLLAIGAAVAWMPEGPITVLRQLRILALAAGGVAVALLAAGLFGAPRSRRAAGVALVVGLAGLTLAAPRLLPDGWRLTAPYLVWSAPAAALFAVAWIARGGAAIGVVVPCALASACLGAITVTGLGLDAAAWALAGPALAVVVVDDRGALPGPWSTVALVGLPGALPAVAGGGALLAAVTAIHPAPTRLAASIVAGLVLVAFVWVAVRVRSMPSSPLDRVLTVALLAVGLTLAFGVRPSAAPAERAATAASGHRLPIDDMKGWRRLSRLDPTPSPAEPPDAGVP